MMHLIQIWSKLKVKYLFLESVMVHNILHIFMEDKSIYQKQENMDVQI